MIKKSWLFILALAFLTGCVLIYRRKNPGGILGGVGSTGSGSKFKAPKLYKKLTGAQAEKYAAASNNAFGVSLVTPDTKYKLIGDLLGLQKESLVDVYNRFGKLSKNGDMISRVEGDSFIKGAKLQTDLVNTLKAIV